MATLVYCVLHVTPGATYAGVYTEPRPTALGPCIQRTLVGPLTAREMRDWLAGTLTSDQEGRVADAILEPRARELLARLSPRIDDAEATRIVVHTLTGPIPYAGGGGPAIQFGKIPAIKALRAYVGDLGLQEAKARVDAIEAGLRSLGLVA